MIFLHCSASIDCGFTGMIVPVILMLIGDPFEMKMSEAFFSAIKVSSFSMNMDSIPSQQFVDARLGAGLGIDLLDDDCAIETIPALGAGQAARNDYGAGGNAPIGHLAGGAVVDLGALADVDPHGDDRTLADDHAFHDLAARADEAVVLDDRR